MLNGQPGQPSFRDLMRARINAQPSAANTSGTAPTATITTPVTNSASAPVASTTPAASTTTNPVLFSQPATSLGSPSQQIANATAGLAMIGRRQKVKYASIDKIRAAANVAFNNIHDLAAFNKLQEEVNLYNQKPTAQRDYAALQEVIKQVMTTSFNTPGNPNSLNGFYASKGAGHAKPDLSNLFVGNANPITAGGTWFDELGPRVYGNDSVASMVSFIEVSDGTSTIANHMDSLIEFFATPNEYNISGGGRMTLRGSQSSSSSTTREFNFFGLNFR